MVLQLRNPEPQLCSRTASASSGWGHRQRQGHFLEHLIGHREDLEFHLKVLGNLQRVLSRKAK